MNKISIDEIKENDGKISIKARKGSQFLVVDENENPIGTYGMLEEKFLPETINEELLELDVNNKHDNKHTV